jgi:hypothetical protein
MDLVDIRWGGVGSIGLAQDKENWRAFVNTVMNHRVLNMAGKLPSGYTTSGLFSGAQLHRVGTRNLATHSIESQLTTIPYAPSIIT